MSPVRDGPVMRTRPDGMGRCWPRSTSAWLATSRSIGQDAEVDPGEEADAPGRRPTAVSTTTLPVAAMPWVADVIAEVGRGGRLPVVGRRPARRRPRARRRAATASGSRLVTAERDLVVGRRSGAGGPPAPRRRRRRSVASAARSGGDEHREQCVGVGRRRCRRGCGTRGRGRRRARAGAGAAPPPAVRPCRDRIRSRNAARSPCSAGRRQTSPASQRWRNVRARAASAPTGPRSSAVRPAAGPAAGASRRALVARVADVRVGAGPGPRRRPRPPHRPLGRAGVLGVAAPQPEQQVLQRDLHRAGLHAGAAQRGGVGQLAGVVVVAAVL